MNEETAQATIPENVTSEKNESFEKLMVPDFAVRNADQEQVVETITEQDETINAPKPNEDVHQDFFNNAPTEVREYGEIKGMEVVTNDDIQEDDNNKEESFSLETEIETEESQKPLHPLKQPLQEKDTLSSIIDKDETGKPKLSKVTIMEPAFKLRIKRGEDSLATLEKNETDKSKPESLTTIYKEVFGKKPSFRMMHKTLNVPELSKAMLPPKDIDQEEETVYRKSSSVMTRRASKKDGSSFRTKQSIVYDVSPRVLSSEVMDDDFFTYGTPDTFVLFRDDQETGEEEEIISIFEEEEPELNRTPYYARYEDILEEIQEHKTKNNVLQKKVCMYLKRRKVENFLKDVEPAMDQIMKYGQKLEMFGEILTVNEDKRKSITDELHDLKRKRDEKAVTLENLFHNMQHREDTIGYGLIHTKTGKPIPDKQVERLIKRQNDQMDQVSTMRLKFIRLKGMVQEKIDAMNSLDKIGNNLFLIDYEQLKQENRNHADKIEEKDEELTRLRSRCQSTIQILAHMREKSSALSFDLIELRDELEYVENISTTNRQNVNDLKKERDKYRQLIEKIKLESGLLTQPELLRDMETSQEDIEVVKEELNTHKEEHALKTVQIRNLRKNIEKLTDILNRKKRAGTKLRRGSKDSKGSKATTHTVPSKISKLDEEIIIEDLEVMMYKGRPSMIMPAINQKIFNDLIKIKPKFDVATRKRR